MINKLTLRTYIVFVLTGIFVGILITAQFRSAIPTSSYLYDQLTVQKELIKSFSDDQAQLKSKIVNLRAKIDENQARIKETSQKNNLEQLSLLKRELGLEMAKGPGILIILNDSAFANRESAESIDQSLVQASDLRDVVNVLRTARASAIAINDQRIIANTPITSVGNTILVNNYHLLPPFNIVAIGDREALMQRIYDTTLLPDLLKRVKDNKIQYSVVPKASLSAPVYNGNLNSRFLNRKGGNDV